MNADLIDVWNVDTFDSDLLAELRCEADLIRDYTLTENRNFLEREASDRTSPYPTNPYSEAYLHFADDVIMPMMNARTIRAWHYTRLTDSEVQTFYKDGIHLSDLKTIRQRLDTQVDAGTFPANIADALLAESPFHQDEFGARSGKFWMTSCPVPINSGLVDLLLQNWGGEGVYFWLKDEKLKALVAGIGKPRVIEVAVPLCVTKQASLAASAVLKTFARKLGEEPDRWHFDLYASRALGPTAVLAVHTEGEQKFDALGRLYP